MQKWNNWTGRYLIMKSTLFSSKTHFSLCAGRNGPHVNLKELWRTCDTTQLLELRRWLHQSEANCLFLYSPLWSGHHDWQWTLQMLPNQGHSLLCIWDIHSDSAWFRMIQNQIHWPKPYQAVTKSGKREARYLESVYTLKDNGWSDKRAYKAYNSTLCTEE